MRMDPTPPGDPLVWRDPELSPWLLGYDHVKDVRDTSKEQIASKNELMYTRSIRAGQSHLFPNEATSEGRGMSSAHQPQGHLDAYPRRGW